MHIIIKEIAAGTAPSNGAIWGKFREQQKHQSTCIKSIIYNDKFALFGAILRCKFNEQFCWKYFN